MSSDYTPFSLHEYLSGMLADSIRVVEDRSATTARVDLRRKVITIPALDYSKPMTEAAYRITKSFVDHESAHILFTPSRYSGGLSHFPEHLWQLVNLMEDVRIERLYSRHYLGIAEDLLELNRKIFREKLLDNIETDRLQSMLSLMFSHSFRVQPPEGRHFNPGTEKAFHDRIQPLLDPFITSNGLHPEKPAQKIYEILQELYARKEPVPPAPKPLPLKSAGKPASGASSTRPKGKLAPEPAQPSTPSENLSPSDPSEEESDLRPIDSSPFDDALCAALSRADTGEYLESQLASIPPRPPQDEYTIQPYHDRIIRIPLTETRTLRRSGLYERTITECASLISSYRALFCTTLISLQKTRTLSTFSGRFDSRHASRLLTSLSARVFTQRLLGTTHSYDVSILLDISASMKDYDGGSEPKIFTATKAMIVLSEALKALPRISFEVLAFTADAYLDLASRRMLPCNKDNVIYELKSFSEKGVGIIPYFYDIVSYFDLCCENFDIAAIKVASSRLLRHPSGNRKLLMVLSDGMPCCRNNASERILSDYVLHVSEKHPIFGIGIENPHIMSLYPHSVNVSNLSTLGTEVLSTIRQFILRDAHAMTSTPV